MLKEIMIFMMQSKLKNLLLLRVPMKLLLFLKILTMALTNLRALLYFSIALKITMTMIILLIILRESLPQRKRLMFCRTLWKKLLKLKAPWMKKRRRVTNKRRKNGDIHVYLLMRVTLSLLPYMSVMILWIFLKYPFLMKLMPYILVAMMPLWMILTEMNLLQ